MSAGIWRHPIALGLAGLVLAILAAATFAIVPETQQAVVMRLEQPVGVVNAFLPGAAPRGDGAGLVARVPFLDRLIWIDKRVIGIDTDSQPLITADGQGLSVDAGASVRVEHPIRLVLTQRNEQHASEQLRALLTAEVRDEVARRTLAGLLGPDRDAALRAIREGVARKARLMGVAVIDLRLRRTELSPGPSQDKVVAQMRATREQQASAIRADGRRAALAIQARADADAAQMYAQSFSQDAEAYDFYRAMQSYRTVFGPGAKGSTTFVLSPGNAYLRQFEGHGGEPSRAPAR